MIIGIDQKYTLFRDFNGTPLDDGYIYIGEEKRNPIVYPIAAYFDSDYQIEAAQPIRTSNGYALYNGKPSNIYVSENLYSLLINDRHDNKITYQPSKKDLFSANPINENLLNNGDWQLFGTYYQPSLTDANRTAYNWYLLTDGTHTSYQFLKTAFDIGQINNSKFYASNTFSNIVTPETDAYRKLSQFVDDFFNFNGNVLTLSFRARAVGEIPKRIAVSFDTFISGTTDTTSIGVKTFILGEDFETYTHTVKMISYKAADGIEPFPHDATGLVLNFWSLSGSDFVGQTNLNQINTVLEITDIKLEFGIESTTFKRDSYQIYENRYSRKFETTFERDGRTLLTNQPGYIEYVSPGIQSFIPGFRFRKKKCLGGNSTVRIFSYATKTEGYVTLVGTGDIEVTSVADIGWNGCGQLNLAANTAAGNVYKYHYIVEDEFTL